MSEHDPQSFNWEQAAAIHRAKCAELEAQLAAKDRELADAKATLAAIYAVNDRTCPMCDSHIVSVTTEQRSTDDRVRIVWTCCNGCPALEGEGPFRWMDFLDEAMGDQLQAKDRDLARAVEEVRLLREWCGQKGLHHTAFDIKRMWAIEAELGYNPADPTLSPSTRKEEGR